MRISIGYENGLFMEVEGQALEEFRRSSLWKMRMPRARRRAVAYEGQRIWFDRGLSFSECAAVVDSLSIVANYGYEIAPRSSYQGYEERERSLIDEKSRVALAIKAHSEEVLPQFSEYAATVNAMMVRPLRDLQMWDSFFMCSMGKSANFSVPGSGKTATTLGMYAFLKEKGLVQRLLVVCPKNAFASWREEWTSCFGGKEPCRPLCFHDARFSNLSSAERRRTLRLDSGRFNLILINYESLDTMRDELRSIAGTKTMLVFDEVHKVKKIDGIRASAALDVSKDAEYVVALTGTPIPNSYCDIYNLLHILYPEDYDTFFGFRPNVLEKPSTADVDRINKKLQPFFCRTNKDCLGVPRPLEDDVLRVRATSEETFLLRQLKTAYKADPLALIIRILQMESDPSMLLETIEKSDFEGFFEGPDDASPELDVLSGASGKDLAASCPTSKFLRCVSLCDSLCKEGKTVIVWCFFKRSMDNLQRALLARGWDADVINGSVPQQEREAILSRFKSGSTRVLVTNPHTLAESVSLHQVCHDAIYFEYSYNLVHLLQSKDRIHRLGLRDDQYTQYHFMQSEYDLAENLWSLDGRIYERLKEKEQVMLDAIDSGSLEIGSTDSDDLAIVFQGLFDSE